MLISPVGPAETPKETRRPKGCSASIAAPENPSPRASKTTVGASGSTAAASSAAPAVTTSSAPGALHPEGAGQGGVGRHAPLRHVAVDGVDAPEGHVDDDVAVAGSGQVGLLHHERLAGGVETGASGAGGFGRHGRHLLLRVYLCRSQTFC